MEYKINQRSELWQSHDCHSCGKESYSIGASQPYGGRSNNYYNGR